MKISLRTCDIHFELVTKSMSARVCKYLGSTIRPAIISESPTREPELASSEFHEVGTCVRAYTFYNIHCVLV